MKKIFTPKINIFLTFLLLFIASAIVFIKPQADESTTSCSSVPESTATQKNNCIAKEISSSAQTIKGEVTSTQDKSGEPGNYCAKFKLGISGHHDIVILEKNEASLEGDLLKCQEVAKNLKKAFAEGKLTVNKIEGIPQPFRENYYYERNYPEQVVVPGTNYTFFHDLNSDNNWKYDKNYYDYFFNDYPNNPGGVSAIQSFCRVHMEEKTDKTAKILAYEMRYRPANNNQIISKCASIQVNWTCNHKNVFTYGLKYETKQNGTFLPITATEPHKCDEMKLTFTPTAEWFQTLTKASDDVTAINNVVPLSHDMFVSPPTNILSCENQTSCLNDATKQTTLDEEWGKGAQKVPAGFVETVQSSINAGDDTGVECKDGKCISYLSGERGLLATIPANSYFGECGKDDFTIDLPEAKIPQVVSNNKINIINRPPTVQVGFSKTTLAINEEMEVTCDAADPDTCSDKIIKIKWKCFDSNGLATNCYFGKNGIWKAGDLLEEIPESSATNPYRATANFKVSTNGNYAVSCEAWDNDKIALNSNGLSGSSSSIGIAGINVGGVIAAEMNFCAIISDSEESEKTTCGETGKAKFMAYSFGIEPQSYKWQCSKGENVDVSTSDKKECLYKTQGSFSPSLIIIDKEGKEHNCTSTSSVKVSNVSKCQVLSRLIGSNEDYSESLKVQEGSEVESIVKVQCLDLKDLKWSSSNGDILSSDSEKSRTKFSVAGEGSVGAEIKKDGNSIKCDSSAITINSTTSFGTQ